MTAGPTGRAIPGPGRPGDRVRTTAGGATGSNAAIPAISGVAGAAGSPGRAALVGRDGTRKLATSVKWLTERGAAQAVSVGPDKKTGGVAHAPRVCRLPVDRERSNLAQAARQFRRSPARQDRGRQPAGHAGPVRAPPCPHLPVRVAAD